MFQKICAAIGSEYMANPFRALVCLGVLSGGILFGLWSAWFFRGTLSFTGNLVAMTLGYTIPAGIVIGIIHRAAPRYSSPALELLNAVLLCVIFCVLMQWFFFKLGSGVFGAGDVRRARALCERSQEWAETNLDDLRLGGENIETKVPDAHLVVLGNIRIPRISQLQRRYFTLNEKDEEIEHIESWLLCRFRDPRRAEYNDTNLYTYDYKTGVWRQGP